MAHFSIHGVVCAYLQCTTSRVLQVSVCVCVCWQHYDEALALVNESRRQYVTDDCLASVYIPLLLNLGLGFNNHSTDIHVPPNIAGQKPGSSSHLYLSSFCRFIYNLFHRPLSSITTQSTRWKLRSSVDVEIAIHASRLTRYRGPNWTGSNAISNILVVVGARGMVPFDSTNATSYYCSILI